MICTTSLLLLMGLLKLGYFIYLDSALFIYDYYSNRLPSTFNKFLKSINKVHQYATRLASKKSYHIPKARTNYGKFNIQFNGVKLWYSIKEDLKSASRFRFKKLLIFSQLHILIGSLVYLLFLSGCALFFFLAIILLLLYQEQNKDLFLLFFYFMWRSIQISI